MLDEMNFFLSVSLCLLFYLVTAISVTWVGMALGFVTEVAVLIFMLFARILWQCSQLNHPPAPGGEVALIVTTGMSIATGVFNFFNNQF